MRYILIASMLLVAGCAMNKYTGQSFYYNLNNTPMECREPEPWKGGNCRPSALWEKPS